jgi:tRNA pseudouridine38-40 synthase
MLNIKLTIAYDGTSYLGWQKTPIGKSVESTLQSALEKILQHSVVLQAASRTDAGVHAQGQVVNFIALKTDLHLERLKMSIICLLPKDIALLRIEVMPPNFHPTLDCLGKEYRYYVCYAATQMPQYRLYAWHYPHALDLNKMRAAIPFLLGHQDFSAFCNGKNKAKYKDFKRHITAIDFLNVENQQFCVRIQGNNFLYKMVRNLVGTLVQIGRGKIALDQLPQLLEAGDRTQIGMTAPAHGLFLEKVFY